MRECIVVECHNPLYETTVEYRHETWDFFLDLEVCGFHYAKIATLAEWMS